MCSRLGRDFTCLQSIFSFKKFITGLLNGFISSWLTKITFSSGREHAKAVKAELLLGKFCREKIWQSIFEDFRKLHSFKLIIISLLQTQWIFSSKNFLKWKWNPQYRKQSEEELASRIHIAQIPTAFSCLTVLPYLLLTSGFKWNPFRGQLTSHRVLEKASMRELHRVLSVTWELEQDFYSKPFFFHFSSLTFSLWRVWEQFIWSLHLYPLWIFYMRGIDPCYSWGWKWLLVALKSNVAQCRAISKAKSGCSGPCPVVSWASSKNASPRMELSFSQSCTNSLVDFFPPCIKPVVPLLRLSAVVSQPFPGHLREPGSILAPSSQTSRGEGQQLSPPFASSVCPAQPWYHYLGVPVVPIPSPGHSPSQAPQGALCFWSAPKAPRAHHPLPDHKSIWMLKCWSLPPSVCEPQSFTKSGLSNPAPWSPSLSPLSV